jgi:hypothetical protein
MGETTVSNDSDELPRPEIKILALPSGHHLNLIPKGHNTYQWYCDISKPSVQRSTANDYLVY